jgi:hypothetical protein
LNFKLNFKSIEEAFNYTLSILKGLQKNGIKIEKYPSNARFIQEIIDDFRKIESRLKPKNWYHVELTFVNPEQKKIIYDAQKDLLEKGITFDTGGIGDIRDWELDWSFHLIDEEERKEKKERISIVSDVLNTQQKVALMYLEQQLGGLTFE